MANRYVICLLTGGLLVLTRAAYAEINIISEKYFDATMSLDERTDFIGIGNTTTLDNKIGDGRVAYLGLDYYIDFNVRCKDQGPELYAKAQRNGPFNYSAPVIINHTLNTSAGKVKAYNEAEYLPYMREFWVDVPLYFLPTRFRAGLFPYGVGHDMALCGEYENYGMNLKTRIDCLEWNVYYCYPDLANKRLGPSIIQEKQQGMIYDRSKANFFASDVTIEVADSVFQPYIGVLIDHTGTKRSNLFSTPTVRDTLGTMGFSGDIALKDFSFSFELARNFGRATPLRGQGGDPESKYVEHSGYLIFSDAAYTYKQITPHARFVYASGNKVTGDMVNDNYATGNTTFTSGKNRAFSSYSPLNANLADAMFPPQPAWSPLVATGNGWGMNYGINRPGTFNSPGLFENLVLFGAGFDCKITEGCSFTANWWHLGSAERGVGMLYDDTVGDLVARELSPDLGNEIDIFVNFDITKNMKLALSLGYFMPGKYYREYRDDTDGSLFTPFIRGDGEADPAYQVEVSFEVNY